MVDGDGMVHPPILEWLKTEASFDDVADALEARAVSQSWHAAAHRNAELRREAMRGRR